MWGRKMIFISNYPDKLDKAFLRPGRIDLNIELNYCSESTFFKIINNFYRIDLTNKQLSLLKKCFMIIFCL